MENAHGEGDQPQQSVSSLLGSSPSLSYNSLLNRPRSNPRSRTPMRYESPLDPDAFRRVPIDEESPVREERRSVGRVRPWAGAAVGTIITPSRPVEKSSKQGPSKRKIKRWKNDNLRGLAAELSSASPRVAELFLQAHADAAAYKSYYDPHEQSKALNEFYEKDTNMRDQFFRGEIGTVSQTDTKTKTVQTKIPHPLTPTFMMSRVHARLQKVLDRLHSSPSTESIDKFECFLVWCLGGEPLGNKEIVWDNVIVEPPLVMNQERRKVVRFVFAQNAGLHRIFLHAVCQFHGLHVSSYKSSSNVVGTRCLAVTGVLEGPEYRLMDHVNERKHLSTEKEVDHGEAMKCSVPSLTETMSTLKVG